MEHTVRQPLPDRRPTWTQRVKIGGFTFYASFGEYADGHLGEVFAVGPGADGAFTKGILDSMSRALSIALQEGLNPTVLGQALLGINYPPNGPVLGSPAVTTCLSVTDWLGREILHYYGDPNARCERALPTSEASVTDTGTAPTG